MFLVNIFLRFLIWKSSTRALPDSFSTRFSHRLLARPRCSFHVLLIASWCVSTPGCLIRDEEDRERGGGGEPADLWIALKFFLCDTHTHVRAGALAGISQGDLGFGSGGVRATDHYLLSTERREGITWPPGASGGLRPEWVSIPGPFLSLCPWQRDGQPRSLNACRNSPLYFILGQPRGACWDGGWIPSGDQLSPVTPSSGPCLLWRKTQFRGSAEEGAGFLSPTVGTSDRFHFFSVEMSLNEVLGSSLSLIRAGGGIKKDAKWVFLVLSQLTRLLGLNQFSLFRRVWTLVIWWEGGGLWYGFMWLKLWFKSISWTWIMEEQH